MNQKSSSFDGVNEGGRSKMLSEDVIYQEAGQWLRMANILAWSMGAILIPVMLGAVWLALKQANCCMDKWMLAGGSVLVWFVWLRMLLLYRASVVPVRKALASLEGGLGAGSQRDFYTSQGPLFDKPWGSKFSIVVFSVGLWSGWLIVLGPCVCKLLMCTCKTLECLPRYLAFVSWS